MRGVLAPCVGWFLSTVLGCSTTTCNKAPSSSRFFSLAPEPQPPTSHHNGIRQDSALSRQLTQGKACSSRLDAVTFNHHRSPPKLPRGNPPVHALLQPRSHPPWTPLTSPNTTRSPPPRRRPPSSPSSSTP